MRDYFECPCPLHTRTRWVSHSRLNRDSSVNSTWLQSCCSQSRCSATHLLRPHGGVGSTECRPLAYVHRALPHEADYVLFGWTPFALLPRATVLQLRSILCSVSTGC
ncbi:hypothetical protein TNCV_2779701 [Trichonephila clavipes]|nr:hypothetical protein TNCV_2779701 [Trichonephila clavipes]